jgi:hypothetical protein
MSATGTPVASARARSKERWLALGEIAARLECAVGQRRIELVEHGADVLGRRIIEAVVGVGGELDKAVDRRLLALRVLPLGRVDWERERDGLLAGGVGRAVDIELGTGQIGGRDTAAGLGDGVGVGHRSVPFRLRAGGIARRGGVDETDGGDVAFAGDGASEAVCIDAAFVVAVKPDCGTGARVDRDAVDVHRDLLRRARDGRDTLYITVSRATCKRLFKRRLRWRAVGRDGAHRGDYGVEFEADVPARLRWQVRL